MSKKTAMDQSGRSMIEMLGVLAIVGVLSVAGIQGYSKAMAKYKTNKAMDQISTLAANIKTMFASLGTYGGLTGAERAYGLGLFPEEMTKVCNGTYAPNCVKNAFNGAVSVGSVTPSNETAATQFSITFSGLPKDACTALVTSDWGGASGFAGMQVTTTTTNDQNQEVTVTNLVENTIASAMTYCTSEDANTITLVFK